MRGHVFGISRDLNDAESFSAEDVYEMALTEFDFVVDEDAPEAVEDLINTLADCGADTGTDDEEGSVWHFTITEDVKRNWFRERLLQLQEAVAKASLDEFALTDPYELRCLAEDTHADAVYSWTTGFCSMDRFIRMAHCGEKYFVVHAHLMH